MIFHAIGLWDKSHPATEVLLDTSVAGETQKIRSVGYHALLPELRVADKKSYRNFLRMSDNDLALLLQKVSPIISRSDTKFRRAISPSEKLAVTLRFLATGELR